MVDLVGIFVEDFERGDVIALALCTRSKLLRLFNRAPTTLQLARRRRRPQRMVAGHRHAPVSHAALRIPCRNFFECLFGFFVLKGMQPGDGAIEMFLRLRRAGNGEVNLAEFLRRVVTMLLVLGSDSARQDSDEEGRQKNVLQGCGPFRGSKLLRVA